ncbi:segregation and condensation protein A [Actinomyces polynesiensis]|uniref:segregation and condensation protein A n=1 Tax=Actinomyces polynesiensis TaxID=1325934 RepID=UPI000A7230A9
MVTSREGAVGADPAQGTIDQFQVSLEVFQGPFDLLLQLISRHRLDITEVALSQVTDEFISYMRTFPDLSRTTEFLVVAATLLDMKAAHLLPREEDEEDVDLADLEARDLLFSRLLQYRAFKLAAAAISASLQEHAGSHPRSVPLEPHFAALLPELVWVTGPADLARAAAEALTHTPPTVEVAHLHDPAVPVREQALLISARLRREGHLSFHRLVEDAGSTAVVVSRFLALLELYRRRVVAFSQEEALGALDVTWTGGQGDVDLDIDEYEGDAGSPERGHHVAAS